MKEFREQGETRLQRTDFANQFCLCAEISTALMIFFDSRTRSITEIWVGQSDEMSDDCSRDMIKSAERRLAVWAAVQFSDQPHGVVVEMSDASGTDLTWLKADGCVIGVGAPYNGVYPALVLPEGSGSDHPRIKTLSEMGMAYVTHQLAKESYARCTWMETLFDTAMQVLAIQFLVVRADGKITFDSLKNLPHQVENTNQIARNQISFLNAATRNPELRKAVLKATSPQKRTSIVSVFSSPGVARLVVVTPMTDSNPPLALVLFENDNTDHFSLRQHFFNAYRLTRAESLIAHEILSGRSITEAAEAKDLSLNTVRSYMKQVFAKTGTHKQSELVTLYYNSILPVASNLNVAV